MTHHRMNRRDFVKAAGATAAGLSASMVFPGVTRAEGRKTLKILQYPDTPAAACLIDLSDLVDDPEMVRMGAVRKVEPRNRHPAVDHPFQDMGSAAGGPYSTDDLSMTHNRISLL